MTTWDIVIIIVLAVMTYAAGIFTADYFNHDRYNAYRNGRRDAERELSNR